jgi:hypothetical protein
MLRTTCQRALFALGALLCAAGADAGAARQETVAGGPTEASGARVACSVVDALDKGVPGALVRLRDVNNGQVTAAERTDAGGRLVIRRVHPGLYVLEVVNSEEDVIAVGQPFAAARGESVATFVRLGAKPPGFSSFLSNAAAAAVATAASLGVTAVGPGAQPSSPQR